jgi:thymidylate synthase (FAD)
MQIQTYDDLEIKVIDRNPIAQNVIQFACDLTMKKTDDISKRRLSVETAEFLLNAEHTSVLEHANMTFLASGISRSLLAQITRQRMFSFTSASQHYQDYRGYPMSLRPGWDRDPHIYDLYYASLEASLNTYIALINAGESSEEARQVLPNACTVNLLITANIRALFEFLTVRTCKRNTLEMRHFASELRCVCQKWVPEVFAYAYPPCTSPLPSKGKCNQGKMSCCEPKGDKAGAEATQSC